MKKMIAVSIFLSGIFFSGCSVSPPPEGSCKVIIKFGVLGSIEYVAYDTNTYNSDASRGPEAAKESGTLFGQVVFTLPAGTSYNFWSDRAEYDRLMDSYYSKPVKFNVECISGARKKFTDSYI